MSLPRAALPSRPQTPVPAGAWDCHVHVFGPAEDYPQSPKRLYTPGLAALEDVAGLLDRMNLGHVVLIQPSPYGDDHACLLDALDALGARAAGVACFSPSAPPAEAVLDRMRALGVRALRVQMRFLPSGEVEAEMTRAASLAAELGWHLELHLDRSQLPLLAAHSARFRVPVVLDHMGYLVPGDLLDLDALAQDAEIVVKLSGLYRQPDPGPALALARTLAERSPMRCVWGSDWPHTPPHPASSEGAPPVRSYRSIDAGTAFDALFSSLGEDIRRSILCEVPSRLYGRSSRVGAGTATAAD